MMVLSLTNLCNRNCLHCLVRQSNLPATTLPAAFAMDIIKQALDLGIERFSLTGGEAGLHPGLEQLLSTMADLPLSFDLISNGYEFGKRLLPLVRQPRVRRRLAFVSFSLDGASERSHDALRGSGSFREVVEAAALCHHESIPLQIKSVITELNKRELTQLALLAASLGADTHVFMPLMPGPRAMEGGIVPTPEETASLLDWTASSLARTIKSTVQVSMLYKAKRLFSCAASEDLAVDQSGNLIFCCDLNYSLSADESPGEQMQVLADLKTTPLAKAVARHYSRLAELVRVRADEQPDGSLSHRNLCLWCHARFGKLVWLRQYPGSSWTGLPRDAT